MSKRPPEVRQAILECLCWQVAERNDNLVAEAIYKKEEIDAIYSLEEGALLDEFFDFLKEMGIIPLLEELSLENAQRLFMAVIQIALLYFIKILFGISSMNSLPDLLFSDVDAMKLLGFNAHQIKNGFTNRGDHGRKHKAKQGPISPQALAENICKLSEDSVVKLFNSTIQKLVSKGFIGRYVRLTGDTTDLETTEKWEGAGSVVREERIKQKDGKWVSVEVMVHGFKLGTMWDSQSGIPVAGKVETIEVHDHEFLQSLYDQAKGNLTPASKTTSKTTSKRCQITKLLLDRGFLDGNFLYERSKEAVIFVIVAKNNMRVYKDAHQLAKAILKDGTGGYIQERKETIFHGRGKNKTQEEVMTKVVGIRNLRTYDAYTSLEEYKHKSRKDFAPQPINVVVVKEFKGKSFADFADGEKEKGVVYLTNSPVSYPLKVFDDYDDRSKIENQLFREGKQGWYLENAPQKTKRAMTVHVMLTLTVIALTTAFRAWKKEKETKESSETDTDTDAILPLLGIRAYRRKLKAENRDKVIVFAKENYGIFHIAEFSILAGVNFSDDFFKYELPEEVGNRQDIFRRYCIQQE